MLQNNLYGLLPTSFCLNAFRLVIIMTFLVMMTVPLAAQPFVSRSITVNDGLPQSFVSGIVQDDDGFIWLGTRDGLARYDGREFKVFRPNDGRATDISSNVITGLYHDPKNRIWIFHESRAIDVFDPREEKFYCFNCDSVNTNGSDPYISRFVYVDSKDNVWLNDARGVWRIDMKDHRRTLVSGSTVNLLSDTVLGVVETPRQQYCVVTAKGVQLLDENLHVLKTLAFDASLFRDPAIIFDPVGLEFMQNNLLLIRRWNAAFVLDLDHFTMTRIANTQAIDYDDNATAPQKDPSGNRIIEIGGELYQVNKDQSVKKIWSDATSAVSFYVDHSGVAWMSDGATGVQTVNLSSVSFHSSPYTDGFFNFLLSQQAIRIPQKSWLNYSESRRFAFDSKTRFSFDSRNRLWLTCGHDAAVIDFKSKTLMELPPVKAEDNLLSSVVSRDTCWRLGASGPLYYDEKNRSWVFPLGKKQDLLRTSVVFDLIKTGNTIWATTQRDGLISLNLKTGKAVWYDQDGTSTLSTNQLTDIEHDPGNDSIMWIGSRSGLIRFNRQTSQFRTFTVKDGLPNNTIYCILSDQQGFLWLSTNKGLCRFDPVSHETRNFSKSDGLQGNEFNFFHKLKLPDGRMAFGGTEGITVFDPLQIWEDSFQPMVQLTNLKINNNLIEFGDGNQILKTPLNSLSSLHLGHDLNSLTFYFAGLQFNNVEKTQYRFRLNGVDTDWNYSGALGLANYTRIPPGDYELELNAANTSGIWSKNVKRISITIDPPWWKTTWAYLLYAALFAGAVFGYIRYTVKKIRLENLVELKNKEAEQLRQLGEFKNKFFTNITHEFRTPITLIISPLEQLLRVSDLPETHKEHLKLIRQNSRQLLQLINQLLDLSKLEAGLLKLSLVPVDIEKFLEELILPFYSIADSQRLLLSLKCEIKGQSYLLDRDKLECIVTNLLLNAIKFTDEGGSIEVRVTKAGHRNSADLIRLQITDTGTGIPETSLSRIFDRFYQVDDKTTRTHGGTGIGLSLVKEMISLLQGTITVESVVNKGTTFTAILPLEQTGQTLDESRSGNTVDPFIETASFHKTGETEDHRTEVKPLILIVEDNDSLRAFLAGQLAHTYSVVTATNGQEGWEKTAQEMPELVITDVMMPYLDGMSLSRKIRQTEATSHIGLIMLTARASAESRIEGLQTGANDYISKPFSFEELQLRIANLLTHQKKQREYFHYQLLKNGGDALSRQVENEFLAKAYGFLDKAQADKRPVGVEDLADYFSMSSRTLNRKLSALVGVTAGELIRNYRLSLASTLLLKKLTISEAAYEAGFESSQYFAQCFKAVYKITPTEYIQQQQNKNHSGHSS